MKKVLSFAIGAQQQTAPTQHPRPRLCRLFLDIRLVSPGKKRTYGGWTTVGNPLGNRTIPWYIYILEHSHRARGYSPGDHRRRRGQRSLRQKPSQDELLRFALYSLSRGACVRVCLLFRSKKAYRSLSSTSVFLPAPTSEGRLNSVDGYR